MTAPKLSREQVFKVITSLAFGTQHERIARRFGVSTSVITHIATGRTYQNVCARPQRFKGASPDSSDHRVPDLRPARTRRAHPHKGETK